MKLHSLLALAAMMALSAGAAFATSAVSHKNDTPALVAHAPPANVAAFEFTADTELYAPIEALKIEAAPFVDTAALTVRLLCPVRPGYIASDGLDDLAGRRMSKLYVNYRVTMALRKGVEYAAG